MQITEPLIELLAIKLYEHDCSSGRYPMKQTSGYTNWMKMSDEDRELYRKIARGETEIEE